MKYRKKPVEVEAFRFGRDIPPAWYTEALMAAKCVCCGIGSDDFRVEIHTLEGTMVARIGDYIIRGVKGEIYPCKADIFEMTYEVVE